LQAGETDRSPTVETRQGYHLLRWQEFVRLIGRLSGSAGARWIDHQPILATDMTGPPIVRHTNPHVSAAFTSLAITGSKW